MGLFNLGGIIGAFAGPKLDRVVKNEQIDAATTGFLRDLWGDQLQRQRGYQDEYERAVRGNIGTQTRLAGQGESDINKLFGELGAGNYLTDRDYIRSGDLASLGNIIGQLGGGGTAADKAAMARLGYAGRPSGSYQTKVRQGYLGAFAQPLLQQIYGGLNTGAAAARQSLADSVAQRLGLIGARGQLYNDIADQWLKPMASQRANIFTNVGALSGLSDVANQNFGGFRERKNKWAALGEAMDESGNSAADMFMSLLGSGGGGGGAGGGLGGLGGMTAGGATKAAGAAGIGGGVLAGLI